MLWFVTATALLCFVMYLFAWSKARPRLALPGQRGISLLGNLLQLDFKAPHIQLSRSAEQYGGMFTINMKGRNCVVVSNYDLLYEMLVQRGIDFANRPDTFRLDYVSFKGRGLVTQNIDQKLYKVGRSVMHKSWKQYSLGMDKIQDVVIAMLKNYKVKLENTKGKPYKPTIAINYFVDVFLTWKSLLL